MTVLPQPLLAARMLGLFALIGIGLVSLFFYATDHRISQNQHKELLLSLKTVLADTEYDNDPTEDIMQVNDIRLGTSDAVTLYRARIDGKIVATVIAATAPDGYNGNIKLLIAILADGQLAGVRVVAHKETPGLGDDIEASRSHWILSFNGKSLGQPAEKQWAVKRDGGDFDQFTGATITPRAVVKAVKNSLHYFAENKSLILYDTP
ncbi:MAG: electron transport complex subunit RsxG [Methylococcaceae bacterium]|jgi:electron transport complex protein RnfG